MRERTVKVKMYCVYTAIVKIKRPLTDYDKIEKILSNKSVITWKEKHKNGVIRHDIILIPTGEILTIDTVPIDPPDGIYLEELRISCRDCEKLIGRFLSNFKNYISDDYYIHRTNIDSYKNPDGSVGYKVG